MRAFVAVKGSVLVLAATSMENVGSIDGIILPSHCRCISVDKGSSFALSPLKHTALELFLAAVASWLPYDNSMKWPNPESLPVTYLYIPS